MNSNYATKFSTIAAIIILNIACFNFYQKSIDKKLDIASYEYPGKIFINQADDHVEFKKYCELNKDKCGDLIFKGDEHWPEYYFKWNFLGTACYADSSNSLRGFFDANFQRVYYNATAGQFICAEMLNSENGPNGYIAIFPLLFIVSCIIFLVGKIFKNDKIIYIGKTSSITQLCITVMILLSYGIIKLIMSHGF
jgi:hypothetical protein